MRLLCALTVFAVVTTSPSVYGNDSNLTGYWTGKVELTWTIDGVVSRLHCKLTGPQIVHTPKVSPNRDALQIPNGAAGAKDCEDGFDYEWLEFPDRPMSIISGKVVYWNDETQLLGTFDHLKLSMKYSVKDYFNPSETLFWDWIFSLDKIDPNRASFEGTVISTTGHRLAWRAQLERK